MDITAIIITIALIQQQQNNFTLFNKKAHIIVGFFIENTYSLVIHY